MSASLPLPSQSPSAPTSNNFYDNKLEAMWCGIIYLVSWTVDVYNGQLWLECANIQMHKLYQVIRASSAESIWSGVRHCVWSMGWLKRFCFCSLRMCLCLARRLNIHKNTIDSVVFQLSHGVSMTSFDARKLLSMYCRQAHCKLSKLLAQFFSKDLWVSFSIWCISLHLMYKRLMHTAASSWLTLLVPKNHMLENKLTMVPLTTPREGG